MDSFDVIAETGLRGASREESLALYVTRAAASRPTTHAAAERGDLCQAQAKAAGVALDPLHGECLVEEAKDTELLQSLFLIDTIEYDKAKQCKPMMRN